MFAALANDDKFAKLCLSKDNWPIWSKKMLQIMKVSELDGYLFGRVPNPTSPSIQYRTIMGQEQQQTCWFPRNVCKTTESSLPCYRITHIRLGQISSLVTRSKAITQVCLVQKSSPSHTPRTSLRGKRPLIACEISALAYTRRQFHSRRHVHARYAYWT